ncbi:MAG: hypothetical protein IT428_19810 [Planctomycetaceae bacterium]|nr:hypothetical protein [Planctomycetaceae bacterium]
MKKGAIASVVAVIGIVAIAALARPAIEYATQTPEQQAVRAWLSENSATGKWEEVRWWDAVEHPEGGRLVKLKFRHASRSGPSINEAVWRVRDGQATPFTDAEVGYATMSDIFPEDGVSNPQAFSEATAREEQYRELARAAFAKRFMDPNIKVSKWWKSVKINKSQRAIQATFEADDEGNVNPNFPWVAVIEGKEAFVPLDPTEMSKLFD